MAATRRPGGLPPCGFMVSATSGGQIPIAIEKRAKGKKVTVISNVQGNARALCTALTTLLGVGGTLHERSPKVADVEVQGEQVERVSAALRQLGCLRGMPRTRETAESVVQRESGYDEMLLQSRPERKPRHAETTVTLHPPPLDAPCRKWHGDWIYCTGSCKQVDVNDIWIECSEAPTGGRALGNHARSAEQLDALLQPLGMLAAPGDAVLEWHAGVRLLQEETARKRNAPKPSLCAMPNRVAKEGQYACKECGAVFSMMRTLKKHEQMHKEEKLGDVRGMAAPIAEMPSWRGATEEESAYCKANEEFQSAQWDASGYDYSDEVDSDLERYQAQRASTSVSSWLSLAVDKHVQKQKDRKHRKPSAPQRAIVPCPVCGGSFPDSEINQHIDVCLTSVPQNATCIGGQENGNLTQEMLQSLLELDLPDDVAERFWEYYEQHLARGSTEQDAFLAALEVAIGDDSGHEPTQHANNCRRNLTTSAISTCPVCYVSFPSNMFTAEIEEHVEQCLTRGSIGKTALPSSIAESEVLDIDPSEEAPELEEDPEEEWQEVKMNKQKGADSIKMKPGRRRRWDPFTEVTGIATQSPTSAPSRKGASAKASESAQAECSTKSDVKERPSKVAEKSAPMPKQMNQFAEKSAPMPKQKSAKAAPAKKVEQPLEAWLLQALQPLMDSNAVEAVIAGVQAVLGCEDDEDAASNAADLLAAELPGPELPGSVLGEEVLLEFKKRVSMSR